MTNNVVLTTTRHGDLYALNAATGAVLFKTPMSAGRTHPSPSTATTYRRGRAALPPAQRDMIIAYKLGARQAP